MEEGIRAPDRCSRGTGESPAVSGLPGAGPGWPIPLQADARGLLRVCCGGESGLSWAVPGLSGAAVGDWGPGVGGLLPVCCGGESGLSWAVPGLSGAAVGDWGPGAGGLLRVCRGGESGLSGGASGPTAAVVKDG